MSVRRRRRRCQVITIITILLALQRTRFIATFNLLCRGDLARNHQAYRFFKLLPPQSPRGFSALARLYYLVRPTKTAMPRRLLNGPQAAQTHHMNADVTLACERCCVTNGYLQRLVWDRSVFLKRDKKCYVFK